MQSIYFLFWMIIPTATHRSELDQIIYRIHKLCILKSYDFNFLKRVYLEQRTLPHNGGGIFRVTPHMLQEAEDNCLEGCYGVENEMKATEKPIISAIITAVYISVKVKDFGEDDESQASAWLKNVPHREHKDPSLSDRMTLELITYDCSSTPIDVILLYAIENLTSEDFHTVRHNAKEMFSLNYHRVRYAMITSATKPKLEFGFHESREERDKIIDSLIPRPGDNNLHEGLYMVREKVFRKSARYVHKVLVIINSAPVTTLTSLIKQANRLKAEGVKIYLQSVDYGGGMREVVSSPDCMYFAEYKNRTVNYLNYMLSILGRTCESSNKLIDFSCGIY